MGKIIDCAQYDPAWWEFRCGKPSASNAKKLITSTGAKSKSCPDYSRYLAGCQFAGKDIDAWEGTKFTDRGTEIEAEARAYYSLTKNVDVDEIGSFTDDMEQYIASPDGAITSSKGLLEVKVLKPVNHINALLYYKKNRKPPPLYIPQCQMSLFVSEYDWLDLEFYNPDLPALIIRIEPDEKVINCLACQLTECLKERDNTLKILESL